MATTTLSTKNTALIQNSREVSALAYHDEISKKIREAFAELSDSDIENALATCSIGKSYTIEILVNSDIFEKKHHYDINNTLSTSQLFNTVKRISFSESNNPNYVNARIWLRGDVRKFLPKNHRLYHSGKSN